MFERAAGLEMRSRDLEEGMVLPTPTQRREVEQHPGLIGLFWSVASHQTTTSVSAEADQAVHPLGMAGRVFETRRLPVGGLFSFACSSAKSAAVLEGIFSRFFSY
jgi:hypothetical protein